MAVAMREDMRIRENHLRALKIKMMKSGGAIAAEKKRIEEAEERINDLKAIHTDIDLDYRAITHNRWIIISLAAAYIIDCIIFYSTAEYLSKQADFSFPGMEYLAKFLIPAAIICIEIGIGMHIYVSRRDWDDFSQNRFEMTMWYIFGVIVSIVMPVLVITTNLITYSLAESRVMQTAIILLILAIVALSACVHMPLIFKGREILQSFTFLTFTHKLNSQQRVIRQCNGEIARHKDVLRTDFERYSNQLENLVTMFPGNTFSTGLFDNATRESVNEIYGREMFMTGNVNSPQKQGEQPGGGDSGEQENAFHGHSMNADESEVRV